MSQKMHSRKQAHTDRPILSQLKKEAERKQEKSDQKQNAAIKEQPKFHLNVAKTTLGRSKYPVIIGTIGAIATILFSSWFLSIELQTYKTLVGYILSGVGLACGILMLIAAVFLLRSEKHSALGSGILIFGGVISLLPGGILPPFLAIVAGIMAKSKKVVNA